MKSKAKKHNKSRKSLIEVPPPTIIKDKFLPESDSTVKSIIEKLISLTISKSIKNRIEKEIPNKCFNFIKDFLKHKLEVEFLPHDIDDSQNGKNPNELSIFTNKFGVLNNSSDKDSENKSNSFIIKKINDNDIINNSNNNNTIIFNTDQIFYNNHCEGENNWDIMDEPKSSKYDRYSVSLIKFKEIERQEDKIINKNKKGIKINDLEAVKEEESISIKSRINKEKDNQRNKKDSILMNTIDISKNIQRKSIIEKLNSSQQAQAQIKRKRNIVDINQFPYEDINDDDEYHEENDNIDYDKLRKELIELEEAKLKEEARRRKKHKIFDIKQIIGENSKQYYGKNVTVDPNGKIVLIKRINIDRLKKEFTTAKTTLKNIKQKKVNKKIENKEKENNEDNNNNIINKDKETIDNDKKNEINNLIEQLKTINNKGSENKILPKIGNKRGSTSNNEVKSENNETKRNKKESIIPSGSNFNIINMEIGVSIKEDEKFKTGGKDFFKKFNKYSKEIYDKKLKESIEANSFLKLPTNYEENNKFKTVSNFEDKGRDSSLQNDTNSKYLMTSTNNFVNSNYLSNLIGSYNINNFNQRNDYMTKTHTSYMNTNHSNILNPSIKLSNVSSLVGSINKLSLITENEERIGKKNTNLFKGKNLKHLFLNNLNEMNQFTKEILKTSDWSTRIGNKSEGKTIQGYAKPYTKPNIFQINREIGYGNKSIRSRSKVIPTLINPALQTVAFFKS
jgi:hypothetical protein